MRTKGSTELAIAEWRLTWLPQLEAQAAEVRAALRRSEARRDAERAVAEAAAGEAAARAEVAAAEQAELRAHMDAEIAWARDQALGVPGLQSED